MTAKINTKVIKQYHSSNPTVYHIFPLAYGLFKRTELKRAKKKLVDTGLIVQQLIKTNRKELFAKSDVNNAIVVHSQDVTPFDKVLPEAVKSKRLKKQIVFHAPCVLRQTTDKRHQQTYIEFAKNKRYYESFMKCNLEEYRIKKDDSQT